MQQEYFFHIFNIIVPLTSLSIGHINLKSTMHFYDLYNGKSVQRCDNVQLRLGIYYLIIVMCIFYKDSDLEINMYFSYNIVPHLNVLNVPIENSLCILGSM